MNGVESTHCEWQTREPQRVPKISSLNRKRIVIGIYSDASNMESMDKTPLDADWIWRIFGSK